MSIGKIQEMHVIYGWPSLMKLFKPDPRPVTAALPPRATVIAVNTALLPPWRDYQVGDGGYEITHLLPL